jgi:hypothetical protein
MTNRRIAEPSSDAGGLQSPVPRHSGRSEESRQPLGKSPHANEILRCALDDHFFLVFPIRPLCSFPAFERGISHYLLFQQPITRRFRIEDKQPTGGAFARSAGLTRQKPSQVLQTATGQRNAGVGRSSELSVLGGSTARCPQICPQTALKTP